MDPYVYRAEALMELVTKKYYATFLYHFLSSVSEHVDCYQNLNSSDKLIE